MKSKSEELNLDSSTRLNWTAYFFKIRVVYICKTPPSLQKKNSKIWYGTEPTPLWNIPNLPSGRNWPLSLNGFKVCSETPVIHLPSWLSFKDGYETLFFIFQQRLNNHSLFPVSVLTKSESLNWLSRGLFACIMLTIKSSKNFLTSQNLH